MDEQEQTEAKNSALNKILIVGIALVGVIIVFTLVYIFKPGPESEGDVLFEETKATEIMVEEPEEEENADDPTNDREYTVPDFTVNGEEDEEEVVGVTTEEEEEPEEEKYADLYISDYSFSEDPKQNEEFTVYIEIKNKGDKTAKDFRWEWWAEDDERVCDDEIDEIEPGDEETVECEYTYEDVDEYETRVVVDSDDDVVESDEDNNEESEDVTPEEEKFPDLYIEDYTHTQGSGFDFTFYVELGNQGDGTAENIKWEWWATSNLKICSDTVDQISPGETRIVRCDYTYTFEGTHQTKAIVDPDNKIDETNEGNNERIQDLPPMIF